LVGLAAGSCLLVAALAVDCSTTGPLSVLWTYDTKPESYYTVALGAGFLAAGTDGMTDCRTDVFEPTSGKLQVVRGPRSTTERLSGTLFPFHCCVVCIVAWVSPGQLCVWGLFRACEPSAQGRWPQWPLCVTTRSGPVCVAARAHIARTCTSAQVCVRVCACALSTLAVRVCQRCPCVGG
jgi:hypothetical protein